VFDDLLIVFNVFFVFAVFDDCVMFGVFDAFEDTVFDVFDNCVR